LLRFLSALFLFLQIPVYRGAENQLIKTAFFEDPPYNGVDGFGDTDLPHLEPVLEEEGAVQAMISHLEQHPGEANFRTNKYDTSAVSKVWS